MARKRRKEKKVFRVTIHHTKLRGMQKEGALSGIGKEIAVDGNFQVRTFLKGRGKGSKLL